MFICNTELANDIPIGHQVNLCGFSFIKSLSLVIQVIGTVLEIAELEFSVYLRKLGCEFNDHYYIGV